MTYACALKGMNCCAFSQGLEDKFKRSENFLPVSPVPDGVVGVLQDLEVLRQCGRFSHILFKVGPLLLQQLESIQSLRNLFAQLHTAQACQYSQLCLQGTDSEAFEDQPVRLSHPFPTDWRAKVSCVTQVVQNKV